MSYKNDLSLARTLLDGFIEYDKRGLPQQKYLTKTDDREARQAIARVLLSERPLDRQLRDRLAYLFACEPLPGEWPLLPERRLIFKFRSKPHDSVRDTHIAKYVHDEIVSRKITEEEAFESAAEKFKMTEHNVKRIWQRFQWAREAGLFDNG
jgi:hypothetical protein